ncbi:hypothetical protein ACKN8S_07885 [Limosilactobacillus reuteri]|uniref:hypothetical protein n=1 Tax=Limosilactobacillus reuteri TaxID=1598 RepID=UPI0039BF9B02
MAKKILLTSHKTQKQAASVKKARAALHDEQAKYRSAQEEETQKAFIELGEKVVKHWKLSSVDELNQWYQQVVNRMPYLPKKSDDIKTSQEDIAE